MDQDIRFAHLVECGFERLDQMGGQFADKSHSVGQQERQIIDNHLAHGCVKGGKQLVFGKHIALAQHIHQCGFPHIGITHQGHTRKLAPVFALQGFLTVYVA